MVATDRARDRSLAGHGPWCSVGAGQARRLVVAVARRADKLEELAREAGGKVLPLPLDLANDAQVGGLVDELGKRGLNIDLLINNAGYACSGPVESVPVAAIRRQFDVNLFGLIGVTQAVLPSMRANRCGRIVNVSSVAGILSLPFLGIYCA